MGMVRPPPMFALQLAVTHSKLVAICFAVWTAFHPVAAKMDRAGEVANAIAWTAATLPLPEVPILSDDPRDDAREVLAAVMARYAVEESWLRPRQVGDHGLAHGFWQLHSAAGHASTFDQAMAWVALLREVAPHCAPGEALNALSSGACDRGVRLATRRLSASLAVVRDAAARRQEIRSRGDDTSSPLD
jgi:hypothetical protein